MEPDSDTSNKYEVSCVIVKNGVQDIYQIPIIISTSYGYSIDLVTVLNTTPLLVTFFMVCLCSRHNNEGLFWSLFGVLQKCCHGHVGCTCVCIIWMGIRWDHVSEEMLFLCFFSLPLVLLQYSCTVTGYTYKEAPIRVGGLDMMDIWVLVLLY